MPIPAECGSCHKRFKANDKLAGKKVKCPQCGGVLTIPAVPPEVETVGQITQSPDEYAPASPAAGVAGSSTSGGASGVRAAPAAEARCPSCNSTLKSGAVLCVGCGNDLRTGRKHAAVAAASDEPEQPRLGILHLLVWIACVAVYFSITRVLHPSALAQQDAWSGAQWVGSGIGSGTALGGLLLFAARRYRGLPFPTQPGETLLVLLGVGAAWGLIQRVLLSLPMGPDGGSLDGVPFLFSRLISLGMAVRGLGMAVGGALYMVAIVRTKILRWRCYFIAVVLAYLLSRLIFWAGFFAWGLDPRLVVVGYASLVALSLPCLVLATVVTKDLLQRLCYGWTHWLGVGLALWNGGMLIVSLVWWILFWPAPF